MKEEAKRKLDALFAEDRSKAAAAEKRRDLEAEGQAAFLEDFREKRDRVVVPAFEEFAVYVKDHGWNSKIDVREEQPGSTDFRGNNSGPLSARVQISFFRSETTPTGGISKGPPSFSVACNKAGRQAIYFASTIGTNHGGSSGADGAVKLDELTTDAVQAKLVSYFEKLIRDARPYDQR